ncbi:hypothetical protein [Candidatus Mycoplasma haematominutum]|uniref:Uncharacterized protein n=1 Tax=Candidatus Mycoplasma haematominutum 'Birmingham 1' TaxID=1116213 RepID=G8C3U6_9MOLU|nr:hypothetical protein [Candidatus Mycoplasma haematominutum]CCE66994.1 hypothetical protein MHM_04760 [Candidatus Mycoplasma haematominutum 'Birmingham 1']
MPVLSRFLLGFFSTVGVTGAVVTLLSLNLNSVQEKTARESTQSTQVVENGKQSPTSFSSIVSIEECNLEHVKGANAIEFNGGDATKLCWSSQGVTLTADQKENVNKVLSSAWNEKISLFDVGIAESKTYCRQKEEITDGEEDVSGDNIWPSQSDTECVGKEYIGFGRDSREVFVLRDKAKADWREKFWLCSQACWKTEDWKANGQLKEWSQEELQNWKPLQFFRG